MSITDASAFKPFIVWEGPYEGFGIIRVVCTKDGGDDCFKVETKTTDSMQDPVWMRNHTLTTQVNGSSLATTVIKQLASSMNK